MTGCFSWLILAAFFIFAMVSLIRWFEQVTDAADRGQWSKVMILLICPPLVWYYPAKVAAGRPMAVPRHEPVRGFGEPAPKAPPPKKKTRAPIDPDAVAKLRQKMKEQGMLEDKDEG
jgi:hypothetical protein